MTKNVNALSCPFSIIMKRPNVQTLALLLFNNTKSFCQVNYVHFASRFPGLQYYTHCFYSTFILSTASVSLYCGVLQNVLQISFRISTL